MPSKRVITHGNSIFIECDSCISLVLGRYCLRYYWTSATCNSAKPDQTPQYAASDQVLHCLFTEQSDRIRIKM